MTIHVSRQNKQFMIVINDDPYAFHSFAQSKQIGIPLQQIRRKIPTLCSLTTVKRGRTVEELSTWKVLKEALRWERLERKRWISTNVRRGPYPSQPSCKQNEERNGLMIRQKKGGNIQQKFRLTTGQNDYQHCRKLWVGDARTSFSRLPSTFLNKTHPIPSRQGVILRETKDLCPNPLTSARRDTSPSAQHDNRKRVIRKKNQGIGYRKWG